MKKIQIPHALDRFKGLLTRQVITQEQYSEALEVLFMIVDEEMEILTLLPKFIQPWLRKKLIDKWSADICSTTLNIKGQLMYAERIAKQNNL